MKKALLRPPAYTDLMNLLAAWRVWIAGAVLGAAIATVAYLLAPPPYRAQATVLVDQNVEEVIPQEQTDLRKYTYLQRETDKLVEINFNSPLGIITSSLTAALTSTPELPLVEYEGRGISLNSLFNLLILTGTLSFILKISSFLRIY